VESKAEGLDLASWFELAQRYGVSSQGEKTLMMRVRAGAYEATGTSLAYSGYHNFEISLDDLILSLEFFDPFYDLEIKTALR